MRVEVLQKVDVGEHGPGWTDEKASQAFDVHLNSVHAIRKDIVLRGFEEALERRKRAEPGRKRVFDDRSEKAVLALAVGDRPKKRARWTLRLLANGVVRLDMASRSATKRCARP